MMDPRPITVALAGDVMLGRGVNQLIRRHGPAYPWGDLLPLLWDVDLFLVNLECALTAHTVPANGGKAFHFRADPEAIDVLRFGRVDCATIANNHILDFGPAGLLETVGLLHGAGIAAPGAGADLGVARRPVRLTAPGHHVQVLAAADHPRHWAAGPGRPGIHYLPLPVPPAQLELVTEAVRAARAGADVLVFAMHWGPNMAERPAEEAQAFAQAVVDAGADLFWGHSAHVPQGVERRGRSLILYDTGDLIDDYAVDAELRNDRSALFLVKLQGGLIRQLDVVPVCIADGRATLATGEARAWRLRRLAQLSAELGTTFQERDGRLVLPFADAVPALALPRR